jgi:histidyl-tRNA synthetase
MKRADRLGAPFVLILGDKELEEKAALLRNMENKEQISVPLNIMIQKIKEMLCQ